MERPANPLLTARLICADHRLGDAIGQALAAEGARLADSVANDGSKGLDILIFVAADASAGTISATTAAAFSDRVGAWLRDAFLALQAGVAAMRTGNGGGSVVLVAPSAGPHRAFDAFRQGLRLMTKAAALELGPEHIRVNIVLPGGAETPIGQSCTPKDIANAVAFAASPRSRFMTGADVVVDGGVLAL